MALEVLLLAELDAHLARESATRGTAQKLLPRVLTIVVPSASARRHLARRLVERAGGALFARVVTLHACALEILKRAGTAAPRGDRLLPVLVREGASRQAGLAPFLSFEVPGRALLPSVTDLIDAGFVPGDLEPAVEALAGSERLSSEVRARATDLVRLAAHVASELTLHGLGGPTRTASLAAEAVRAHADLAPTGVVWIHGYADATGGALDLLEALVQRGNAVVFHDDTAREAFGSWLRERLGIHGPETPRVPAGELEVWSAPDRASEVRAALDGLRAEIESGVKPEDLAITARDLGAYRGALAVQFARAGLPYHAPSLTRGPAGSERRIRALAGLLERVEHTRLARWFDARGVAFEREVDLTVGARVLGVRTLAELASLDLDEQLQGGDGVPLPVRGTLERNTEQDDDESVEREDTDQDSDPSVDAESRAPRRILARATLESARAEARALVTAFGSAPHERTARAWWHDLDALVRSTLMLECDETALALWVQACARVAAEVPAGRTLHMNDARSLVATALRETACTPLGGRGAGIAVLSATEARGRTFRRLHVLGMEHGVFPRSIRPDAVLPDDARSVLRELLPALPEKRVGHDEERVLFEQFLRTAPRLSMSHRSRDDSGRVLGPSPFLERARLWVASGATPASKKAATPELTTPRSEPKPSVDRLHARRAGPGPELRTAHEHAIDAAVSLGRRGYAALLPIALGSARAGALGVGAHAGGGRAHDAPALAESLARARTRTLAELEPTWDLSSAPGPFLGFLGARTEAPTVLPVTRLERYAACPWREFLENRLRVSPSIDPLADLPVLRGRALGIVVHTILEEPYLDGPRDLVTAFAITTPDLVPRALPDLATRLERVAARVLREQGSALPGLARLLAARARPYVLRAYELDAEAAAQATLKVLGVEVDGVVTIRRPSSADIVVKFRADRVEQHDQAVVLVDFKTARPFLSVTSEAKQREHLLRTLADGRHLQAWAYALGAGGTATGEYRYLAQPLRDELVHLAISAADQEFAAGFAATVTRLVEARECGAHPPRLVDPRTDAEPLSCASCEFALGCSRGDSGTRRRIVRIVNGGPAHASGPTHEREALTARAVAAWRAAFALPNSSGSSAPEGEAHEP